LLANCVGHLTGINFFRKIFTIPLYKVHNKPFPELLIIAGNDAMMNQSKNLLYDKLIAFRDLSNVMVAFMS